jgi:hypothetical protein
MAACSRARFGFEECVVRGKRLLQDGQDEQDFFGFAARASWPLAYARGSVLRCP